MKTREEHIEFIKLNMAAVAACAWTGFRAKGRGLVCVLCDQHDEGTRTVPFDFMMEIGNVMFAFQGFESTEGDLFEIPLIRSYVSQINLHFPLWTTFCALDTGMLRMLAACISANLKAQRQTGRRTFYISLPQPDVMKVFVNSIPLASAFHNLAGLAPRDARIRLDAVARYLKLM